MGWLFILFFALAVGIALWRAARFDKAAMQFLAAALLLAFAGYAWQGQPHQPGAPHEAPQARRLPDSQFAATRAQMLGRFNTATAWLTLADAYHREGDTWSAAEILRSGLRQHPNDPDIWVGYGNALVLHSGGLMTPAAQLAFNRAAALAPNHPGPKFFYGLSLAQGGKFDEAERVWRDLLSSAPANAEWRPMVEARLSALAEARAGQGMPPR
jgi:cytochrome c-type biogenesis protein CcmH/NrfG